jgi:glycosyltransferase involved in cell wall biosynthesis
MSVPMWVKKAVRPLVPDSVMAIVRLREHSRQVRTNVDVVVDGWWEQRRWLAATPDTYRVRGRDTFGGAPDHAVLEPGPELGARAAAAASDVLVIRSGPGAIDPVELCRPLSDPVIAAVIAGPVSPPRLVGRRRVEPGVVPEAIAVRRAVWDEVGGASSEESPLDGLPARVRGAGHHLALIPTGRLERRPQRRDPIAADAVVVILALVPLHDVGGGSRGAQLALEFLRQGWYVVYVALYGTAETVDLGLRYLHPNLEQHRAEDVDLGSLVERVSAAVRVGIVEAPVERYVRGAEVLQQGGFKIVYDLIDDWSAPSLGGDWYDPTLERELGLKSDALVASAPDLVDRLVDLTGREVTLVPNAVNAEIFGRQPGPEPDDFPPGEGLVLGYHGSLYGDWFDWDALRSVAESFSEARVVVIGDEPDTHPAMPSNVHFLGLKPQTSLPDYLSRFDAGLIPFHVTDVTHAVSPLKAYEYLAMGVPVAAPPLRSLAGLDGIETDSRLERAVRGALQCPPIDAERMRRAHAWEARVDVLLAALQVPRQVDGHDRGA